MLKTTRILTLSLIAGVAALSFAPAYAADVVPAHQAVSTTTKDATTHKTEKKAVHHAHKKSSKTTETVKKDKTEATDAASEGKTN